MKLPIEPTEISHEATLTRDQVNSLITWYFDQFLNKNVQSVTHASYNNELNRTVVRCRDKAVPNKTTPAPPKVDVKRSQAEIEIE